MSSNRVRQLAEVDLLRNMYPEDFSCQTTTCEQRDEQVPKSKSIALRFSHPVSLPIDYPEASKPNTYLECDATVPTATRKAARQALHDILSNLLPGEEILDILLQSLSEQLSTLTLPTDSNTPRDAQDETDATRPDPNTERDTPPKIRRLLLWTHHLLATSKRKDLTSWARELSLSGFARPGYPGAIVVEGEAEDVEEFERRVKGLRWQALQVRGEEEGERRLLVRRDGRSVGFQEVGELSEVVTGLKECEEGLGRWYLEGMRIGHG